MLVVLALSKLRSEECHEFEASLGYIQCQYIQGYVKKILSKEGREEGEGQKTQRTKRIRRKSRKRGEPVFLLCLTSSLVFGI